jgi:hypothetical protein
MRCADGLGRRDSSSKGSFTVVLSVFVQRAGKFSRPHHLFQRMKELHLTSI